MLDPIPADRLSELGTENADQINWFLDQTSDFVIKPIPQIWAGLIDSPCPTENAVLQLTADTVKLQQQLVAADVSRIDTNLQSTLVFLVVSIATTLGAMAFTNFSFCAKENIVHIHKEITAINFFIFFILIYFLQR